MWQHAFPNTPFRQMVDDKWTEMGWQRNDPRTDFRGAGFTALENHLYMAEVDPSPDQTCFIAPDQGFPVISQALLLFYRCFCPLTPLFPEFRFSLFLYRSCFVCLQIPHLPLSRFVTWVARLRPSKFAALLLRCPSSGLSFGGK